MMLLEHDAKVLLAQFGISIPVGVLANRSTHPAVSYPCFVKVQIPVGGRGKAGGIVKANNASELEQALHKLVGATVRGHRVHECRIEQPASGQECYVSLMLDPSSGKVIILMSAEGGVEVEQHSASGAMLQQQANFEINAVKLAAQQLAQRLPAFAQAALTQAAHQLCDALFKLELTLTEINPLFVQPDGSWIAGDAKLVADDNAIERQPLLLALLKERGHAYPEASLKIDHGFDFVRLDEDGDVGMLTTGAGLSMQLVDELTRRGATVRAYDPVAMHEAGRILDGKPGVSFATDMYDVLDGADALLIATEWKVFRAPDFDRVKALLKTPLIIDGRNLYTPADVRAQGFEYSGIGRA